MSYLDISKALWDELVPRAPSQAFIDGCNAQIDERDRLIAAHTDQKT
jgi:hypothetical protein